MGLFKRKSNNSNSKVSIEENWPFDAPNGFVVFDIETTGLSPASHKIIEIGMVRTDAQGTPLAYWSTLINPQRSVTATEIHGISDDDVSDSPTFEKALDEILERIRGQVLSAHNAKFDVSFLKLEMARAGWELPKTPILCTMQESKNFIPGLANRKLETCANNLGIKEKVEHRALGDASITTALVNFYLNGKTNEERSKELLKLPSLAQKVQWPTEQTFPKIPKPNSTRDHWRKPSTKSQIMKAIKTMNADDLLGDEADGSSLTYAQVLIESLEDGVISKDEAYELDELATSLELSKNNQTRIHGKIISTLAEESWKDGRVARAEQTEIVSTGLALGFSETESKLFIKSVEDLRAAAIGSVSKEIPADWEFGEPLCVGDRVVITGCYDFGRDELEKNAQALGLRITSSVSSKTKLLVSDGSIGGNKDKDAKELGVRTVHPNVFRKLLDFVQPRSEER